MHTFWNLRCSYNGFPYEFGCNYRNWHIECFLVSFPCKSWWWSWRCSNYNILSFALFQEDAATVAMVRHSLNVIKKIVDLTNPGQAPVVACDQPLFAIAKNVQWKWPLDYSEDKFLLCLEDFVLSWLLWRHWEIFSKTVDGYQHWCRQELQLLVQ